MCNLIKEVKSIFNDFCTNVINIECCNYKVSGTLLTHCYYVEKSDKFVFTSGDMIEDLFAEEVILSDEQKREVFESIIECYS